MDGEQEKLMKSSTKRGNPENVKVKGKKRDCRLVRCDELIEYHCLPGFQRDNEFILRYYRSQWPLKQVLFSIFTIHNETLNVWTHLIGFFLFLALTIYTGSNSITTAKWPFFVFMGGAMSCLLASSACHLLCCHSERVSYIMLRLDYAGIAALISTSFYPPVYYSFMCNPMLVALYLTIITLLGLASITFSLLPRFQRPEFRTTRTGLFLGMGLSGAGPVLHKLVLYWDQPEAFETTLYELIMGALYVVGALIYVLRVPERWSPGRFDIAGHSHQLFHLFVLAAAYTHYCNALLYLKWRDIHPC